MNLIGNHVAARIDYGNEGLKRMSGNKKHVVLVAVSQSTLRADRWWAGLRQGDQPDQGSCLGIRCNIWVSALLRHAITLPLRGWGNNNICRGAWQKMVFIDEVRFGTVWQAPRATLPPRKIANFLYEFEAMTFLALDCCRSPSDRARLDVRHAAAAGHRELAATPHGNNTA